MIRKAQKPFIFVGGGAIISNASEELRVFAHKDPGTGCRQFNG